MPKGSSLPFEEPSKFHFASQITSNSGRIDPHKKLIRYWSQQIYSSIEKTFTTTFCLSYNFIENGMIDIILIKNYLIKNQIISSILDRTDNTIEEQQPRFNFIAYNPLSFHVTVGRVHLNSLEKSIVDLNMVTIISTPMTIK